MASSTTSGPAFDGLSWRYLKTGNSLAITSRLCLSAVISCHVYVAVTDVARGGTRGDRPAMRGGTGAPIRRSPRSEDEHGSAGERAFCRYPGPDGAAHA